MGYIKNNNSKVTLGTNPQQASMIFKTDGPLDDRTALATRASLISKQALGARKAGKDTELETDANIKNWVYPAMTCAIQETGEIYVLKDKAALQLYTDTEIAAMTDAQIEAHINKAWTRQALRSDLESLTSAVTGVFAFKGVAESINEAQTILTVSSANLTKGSNTYTAKCQTIGYEYDMDIYYGWGVTADSILFWTDSPTLTATSSQYGITMQNTVKKLVLNGDNYYPVDRTVPAGDGLLQWENMSGTVVYCNESGGSVYSQDHEDPDYELGVAEVVTYVAYDFTPLPDSDKYTVSTVASAAVAAAGNTGHVYQIGEDEYASNGQIWVKLGSPVEDWILI